MYLEIILDGVPTRAHVETSTEGVLLSTDRHLLKIDWQSLFHLYQAPSVKEELELVELNPKASPL
jgi:hypothetical protein